MTRVVGGQKTRLGNLAQGHRGGCGGGREQLGGARLRQLAGRGLGSISVGGGGSGKAGGLEGRFYETSPSLGFGLVVD